nr:hypothetical transcript [Hymenolepis microstoma]
MSGILIRVNGLVFTAITIEGKKVATWCTGEYGNLLLQENDERSKITESDIIDLFTEALTSPVCNLATKEMIISTVMKLSVRLGPTHSERMESLVQLYSTSMNLELQQRSVEYYTVLKKRPVGFREGLFACMPVFAPSSNFLSEGDNGEDDSVGEAQDQNGTSLFNTIGNEATQKNDTDNLLDLLGEATVPVFNFAQTDHGQSAGSDNTKDILDMIMGNDPTPSVQNLNPLSSVLSSNFFSENQLLSQSASTSVNGFKSSSQVAPPLTVYNANSIRIVFEFEHSNDPLDLSFASSVPPCVQIRASSYNSGSLPIESFEMQVAVPKSFQLEMFPPSATCLLPITSDIPPVTQVFKVSNPNRQQLRLRIRLIFVQNGAQKQEQFQIDQLPNNLFA